MTSTSLLSRLRGRAEADDLIHYVEELLGEVFARRLPFLAEVEGTSGDLVKIQRIGSTTPDSEAYARMPGPGYEAGDVVVALPILGGKPVIVSKIGAEELGGAPEGDFLELTGGTLTGPLEVPSLNTPTEERLLQNSANTSSTSGTSYAVNTDLTFDLPTGTWRVMAMGFGLFSHSNAGGSVRSGIAFDNVVDGFINGGITQTPVRSCLPALGHESGLTGDVDIAHVYRPNGSGTAYAGGGHLHCLAFRES